MKEMVDCIVATSFESGGEEYDTSEASFVYSCAR